MISCDGSCCLSSPSRQRLLPIDLPIANFLLNSFSDFPAVLDWVGVRHVPGKIHKIATMSISTINICAFRVRPRPPMVDREKNVSVDSLVFSPVSTPIKILRAMSTSENSAQVSHQAVRQMFCTMIIFQQDFGYLFMSLPS